MTRRHGTARRNRIATVPLRPLSPIPVSTAHVPGALV